MVLHSSGPNSLSWCAGGIHCPRNIVVLNKPSQTTAQTDTDRARTRALPRQRGERNRGGGKDLIIPAKERQRRTKLNPSTTVDAQLTRDYHYGFIRQNKKQLGSKIHDRPVIPGLLNQASSELTGSWTKWRQSLGGERLQCDNCQGPRLQAQRRVGPG